MIDIPGEAAALSTAVAFTFTAVFFTLATRSVGALLVLRVRTLAAVFLVILLHWALNGSLLPPDAEASRWGWLGLSGVLGLALGDAVLLQGLVIVGPRLTSLIMSLAPVMATIIAWIFLGETLDGQEILGMALVIGGIVWVISDNPLHVGDISRRAYIIGLLLAFGGAAGQAAGAVTSKVGLEGDFSPLSAHVIRLLSAAIFIWIYTVLRGQTQESVRTLRAHPRATQHLLTGTLIGPVVGVWLSLIAFQQIAVGVASTLIALTPIFILPLAHLIFHERITGRAVAGTLVAFAGTALLFL